MSGGPFDHLSGRSRRRLFGGALGSVVGVGALMVPASRRMKATGGTDIVGLEMAGTRERVDEIIRQWGPDGVAAARQNLWLDQVWLLTYSTAMALGAADASDAYRARRWRPVAALGPAMGWAPYAAAFLDAVENTSLLALLNGSPSTTLPTVATRAAKVKFALVAVALPYSVTGMVIGAWERRRREGDRDSSLPTAARSQRARRDSNPKPSDP